MEKSPETPKKFYVCGPMRGKSDLNRSKFAEASKMLAQRSLIVRCPNYTEDLLDSYQELRNKPLSDVLTTQGCVKKYSFDDLREIITVDMIALMGCDAVVLLDGWQDSYGATVEVALAQFLGLEMYTIDDEAVKLGEHCILKFILPQDRPYRVRKDDNVNVD